MAAICERCGLSLGSLDRLLGRRVCSSCQRQAVADYKTELEMALRSATSTLELGPRLAPLRAALPTRTARELEIEAFRSYLDHALKDDVLSAEEEARLNDLMRALGIDEETFQREFADYTPRLLVARINDGRLPEVPPERSNVILKKGEVVHVQAPATLLKETTIRKASYSSFSFRVVRGVYFRTGQMRTAPQVERTLLEVDSGTLSVTSQRVVFRGGRHGLEVPYKRLLSVDFYRDGLRLDVAGRSTPPFFRLRPDHVMIIGACINAAAQRHLQK
jgi:hypothetical protein